ncbi:MAG: hypothetical protein ACTSVD_10670 [Candidatus Thorarchaeota archaeon]
MTVEVKVKESSKGQTITFIFENLDYSSYSAKINIWSDSTLLIDGSECTVSYDGTDTIVSYVVESTATATVGDYLAEIVFYSGTTFIEPSETFRWKVVKSGEAL